MTTRCQASDTLSMYVCLAPDSQLPGREQRSRNKNVGCLVWNIPGREPVLLTLDSEKSLGGLKSSLRSFITSLAFGGATMLSAVGTWV